MPKHSVHLTRVAIDAARKANVNTLAPDEFVQAEAYLRIAVMEQGMKNSLLAVTYAPLAIEQTDIARRIAMQHAPSSTPKSSDAT